MGDDIINSLSREWLTSPTSAVRHEWQGPLTCEEASGRCTASCPNTVMYVCGGIKRMTTHALCRHDVIVCEGSGSPEVTKLSTLQPAGVRNEWLCSFNKSWVTQTCGHVGGGTEEFSSLRVPAVFIRSSFCAFLYSEQFYCTLGCSLAAPGPAIFTISPVPLRFCWVVPDNAARALPAVNPVQLCHVINLHFCVSWMRLRRIMLWT